MFKSRDDRIDSFLSQYNFYPNSIDLRIATSKAIELWKSTQAFQLNQISNGKFHFQPNKKEILLLKYDLWSRCVYEVENYMIEISNNNVDDVLTACHIDTIIDLADKTTSIYKDIVLNKHADRFDPAFTSVWLDSHEVIYNIMKIQIQGLLGFSFILAFSGFIEIVSRVMQYTLIELHELNELFCFFKNNCPEPESDKNKFFQQDENIPFMIVTPSDEIAFNITGKYLVEERFKIYKRVFNIEKMYFKNYSDKRIPHKIFEIIENEGTQIEYKLNY